MESEPVNPPQKSVSSISYDFGYAVCMADRPCKPFEDVPFEKYLRNLDELSGKIAIQMWTSGWLIAKSKKLEDASKRL